MLTPMQQSSARFDGGKPLAMRRSRLRGLRTALGDLHNQPTGSDSDKQDLLRGMAAITSILAELETDIAEAKRIKRAYDQRHAAAAEALATLPAATVAEVIALAELDRQIGSTSMLLADVESYGWNYVAANMRQSAVAGLAHRCASDTNAIARCVEHLRGGLPAAAERRADLIRSITTLAVAEQIQRASQPQGAPQ